MSRLPVPANEVLKDLHFPSAGLDVSQAFGRQPNRPVVSGDYARTAAAGVNVRGYEPGLNRVRGGSRPGLAKYIPVQPGGVLWITQELNTVVGVGFPPPGGTMQLSESGRVVTLIAVSQGQVFATTPGSSIWSQATNATPESPPLNFSGLIFSAANNQKLWFADGINYAYYDPAFNTVYPWKASAGILPVDSVNNTPRLICTWRGRTVLSGLIKDPQNWFMSKQGDPTNFDYSPLSQNPQQAVAGNNGPVGIVGDVVTTLIPYSDDTLIFGCDHEIHVLQGDPMAGGQLDRVSDVIGMAFGIPWCKDPYGTVYFVSNRAGIYSFVPGQQPVRISQPIEKLLSGMDTGANGIRCLWDDRFQGLHVFITPLAAPAVTTHFFFEQRSGAWWQDQFANTNHNPLACCTLDGNTPGDRVPLIGSWDGYVRTLAVNAPDDDGTAIASTVLIGPILTQDLDDILLKDLQAVLSAGSGQVNYSVLVGPSAEQTINGPSAARGLWSAGRNLTNAIRRSGHAIYVQLSATNPWAMESVRTRIAGLGKVRRRGP